jgi:hypothetical protein
MSHPARRRAGFNPRPAHSLDRIAWRLEGVARSVVASALVGVVEHLVGGRQLREVRAIPRVRD